jgi:N-acetylneuraminic acid mutarotase
VGGREIGAVVATAELYNPTSGTWSTTAPMAIARSGHSATLLPDGRVLVAGGADDAGRTFTSAELFDPGSGTWTMTGELSAARSLHSATLLPNGSVLVAGGYAGRSDQHPQAMEISEDERLSPSAELFDPATGTWAFTGDMVVVRLGHTATLLPNGRVLVAGGDVYAYSRNTRGEELSAAELYDPAAGSWAATTSMHVARDDPTATLLPDGKVLVVSGVNLAGSPNAASAELYDPARGTWTTTASMGGGRTFQTAVALADGRVLVIAGLRSTEGGGNIMSTAEIYDPDGS